MAKNKQINKKTIAKVPTNGNDSTTIGLNTVGTNNIQPASVTNPKLGVMPANTIKANNTAGSATPSDITTVQLAAMFGNPNVVGFTTPGSFNYTPSSTAVKWIRVIVVGGGGSGAGGFQGNVTGGGGGAGGVAIRFINVSTIAQAQTSIPLTVGAGGAAVAAATGGNGGSNSTFGSVPTIGLVITGGGGGGAAGVSPGGPGGGAFNGQQTFTGGYGGVGMAALAAWSPGGHGGRNVFGGEGGFGGVNLGGGSAAGATGIGLGGGGGGGNANTTGQGGGGAGAPGGVVIEEYIF